MWRTWPQSMHISSLSKTHFKSVDSSSISGERPKEELTLDLGAFFATEEYVPTLWKKYSWTSNHLS